MLVSLTGCAQAIPEEHEARIPANCNLPTVKAVASDLDFYDPSKPSKTRSQIECYFGFDSNHDSPNRIEWFYSSHETSKAWADYSAKIAKEKGWKAKSLPGAEGCFVEIKDLKETYSFVDAWCPGGFEILAMTPTKWSTAQNKDLINGAILALTH